MITQTSQEIENLINELADRTATKLSEQGEKVEVTHRIVTKNNSVELNALTIQRPDTAISPQIYIDDIINDINNGNLSLDEARSSITNIYIHNKGEDIAVPVINKDTAKENLFAVVVNKKSNEELLKEVPHTIVANDLAIIPRFKAGQNASFVVKDRLLPRLEMTSSEVVDVAINNTRQAGEYKIQSMTDVIKDMMGVAMDDDIREVSESEESEKMLIITNSDKSLGAIELFVNEECRQEVFDRLGEPAYILPSSTHEVIAVPESSIDDVQYLTQLVGEVNGTELQPDEQLSSHPYHMNENLVISIPSELLEQDMTDNVMTEKTTLHMSM